MNAPRPLSVAEAQARILARFRRGAAETVSLDAALGRMLAADVVAVRDVPPFTNSAMDGYAVRSADTAGASTDAPVSLRRHWRAGGGRCRITRSRAGSGSRDHHRRAATRRRGRGRPPGRDGWRDGAGRYPCGGLGGCPCPVSRRDAAGGRDDAVCGHTARAGADCRSCRHRSGIAYRRAPAAYRRALDGQ